MNATRIMNMASDEEIRNRALAYLRGDCSFEQFEEFFVAETWDERSNLIVTIDHLLAERSLIPESTFKDELATAVLGRRPENLHAVPFTREVRERDTYSVKERDLIAVSNRSS